MAEAWEDPFLGGVSRRTLRYNELLRVGVRLYERGDGVERSKTASIDIDGVWSTLGLTNLDWRCFLQNNELDAVILGANFARQMDAMFDKDLASSDPVDPEQYWLQPLSLPTWSRGTRTGSGAIRDLPFIKNRNQTGDCI